MSRASFVVLFRQLADSTPLAVGYASESSFHKAFAREFGCTPGEYRRRVERLGNGE